VPRVPVNFTTKKDDLNFPIANFQLSLDMLFLSWFP